MNKIKVIIKRPDEEIGHITWISDTLKNLQNIVGGPIEIVTIAKNAAIICNEEGRIRGLEPNAKICGIDFVGDVIIVGVNGEELTSVPEDLTMKVYKELFLGRRD